jgi:ABC-2 type transport system permease protein
MLSMLLAALGGAWWPMEITPAAYQTVVKVLPSTWAMSGLTSVVMNGQGLIAILPQTGILLGFAVVFFAIGIWKLKFE